MKFVIEGYLKKDEIDSNRVDFIMENKEVFYLEANNDILKIPKIIVIKGFLKEGRVKLILELTEKNEKLKLENLENDNVLRDSNKEEVNSYKEKNNENILTEINNESKIGDGEKVNEERSLNEHLNKEELEKIVKELKKLKEKFEK